MTPPPDPMTQPDAPSSTARRASWRRRLVVLSVLLGVLLGVGIFTFDYAGGLSYFSTDPAACANCHIMQPQYDSWQKASHHTVATCVDCHLPHDFPRKYVAKAANGWFHSKGFTLQDFDEPIRIKPFNRDILQENCLECHGGIVHGLLRSATSEADAVDCIHCHRDVGHGDTVGLGGPPHPAELRPEGRTAK